MKKPKPDAGSRKPKLQKRAAIFVPVRVWVTRRGKTIFQHFKLQNGIEFSFVLNGPCALVISGALETSFQKINGGGQQP